MSKSKIIGIAALSAFGIATVVTTSIIAHNSIPSNNMEQYDIVIGFKAGSYTSTELTGSTSYGGADYGWLQKQEKISINWNYIVSTVKCYFSSYGDGYVHWQTTEFSPTGNFRLDHTGIVIELNDGTVYHTWD